MSLYNRSFPAYACLYNNPIDCSLGSASYTNKTLREIYDKYNSIIKDGVCTSDENSCRYVKADLNNSVNGVTTNIIDISNGYSTYKEISNKSNSKMPNLAMAQEEIKKAMHDFHNDVELVEKNPIVEMYNSSLYTNTLWAILGTTVLFYTFHKMR